MKREFENSLPPDPVKRLKAIQHQIDVLYHQVGRYVLGESVNPQFERWLKKAGQLKLLLIQAHRAVNSIGRKDLVERVYRAQLDVIIETIENEK